MNRKMKLSELFKGQSDIEVKSLMSDSRIQSEDAIFFAIKGSSFDGNKYIPSAVKNGAKVIVTSEVSEHPIEGITYVHSDDVTGELNRTADLFYDRPSGKLKMFGVTGTNGKSSITSIIQDVYGHFEPTGYIGTIGIRYGKKELPEKLTTPDINDLHWILNDMVREGMKACAMEVSSIGIEQRRVDMIDFDAAVFTNLTHDHLDYHKTMENYFLAKKKLFDRLKKEGTAVTNADDPYGMRIVSDCRGKIRTYGIEHDADYRAENVVLNNSSTSFTLEVEGKKYPVQTNLVAMFNVYNLMAAIAVIHEAGIKMEDILPYLKHIKQVSGRMEKVDEGQDYHVIVDYAHTPDGFEKLEAYATAITEKGKNIIAVLGSAGKRDSSKRSELGEILDRFCSYAVLTEEDPRNEDPSKIAEDIRQNMHHTKTEIIPDRIQAIEKGISLAHTGDTVLILGKGDEEFMDRDDRRDPYEGDQVIASRAVRKRKI